MSFEKSYKRVSLAKFIPVDVSATDISINRDVIRGKVDDLEVSEAVAVAINQHDSLYNEAARLNDFIGLIGRELNEVIPVAENMGAEFPKECVSVEQKLAFSLRYILDSFEYSVE